MNSVRPRITSSVAANSASPMSAITTVSSSSDSLSRAISREIVIGSSGLSVNFSLARFCTLGIGTLRAAVDAGRPARA